MMYKIFAVIAAAVVAGGIAYAGSSNTNYTSAGTVGFRTTTDGTTNCVGTTACNLANITIWDSAAGANGLAISAAGAASFNATQWGGTAITNVPTAVGTVGTGNTPTLNSYIVGCVSPVCNANGQKTMANSAPVVIASDQSTLPFNAASWGGTAITNVPTAVGTAGTGNTPTINAYIVGGGAAGGTSSGINATYPTTGTAAGAEYLSSPPTLTSGQMVALQTTVNGSLHTTVDNANANGPATMANGSPVTIGGNNTQTSINISAAGTSNPIVAVAGQKIYVMAWDVIAGGTGTIQLQYGVGGTCATGTQNLTGPYPLTAQAGISKGDGSAPVFVTAANNGLCIVTTGTVQFSGSITYQQF